MGSKKQSTPKFPQDPPPVPPGPMPLPAFLGGGTPTTYSNQPGHLEDLAAQMSGAYPSMGGSAAMLAELQKVYRPVTTPDPAIQEALKKAADAQAPQATSQGQSNKNFYYRPSGPINSFGDFARLISPYNTANRR
jgi:hypothetical protein